MNNIQHLLLAYKNLKACSPIEHDSELNGLLDKATICLSNLVNYFILDIDFIRSLDSDCKDFVKD